MSARPRSEASVLLIETVHDLARELHPRLHESATGLDASFERDLGFDSLARMELLSRLEQRFDTRLREREVALAETPGELLPLLGARDVDSTPATALRAEPVTPGLARDQEAPPRLATTIQEVLRWHAEQHPNRTHLVLCDGDASHTVTYGTLLREATRFAHGLRHFGVRPGETVAIMLPTSLQYFFCFYGTLMADAVPVPLYPSVRPSQLEDHLLRQARILDNAQATLLISETGARRISRLLAPLIESL